jgi:hypothetical protein
VVSGSLEHGVLLKLEVNLSRQVLYIPGFDRRVDLHRPFSCVSAVGLLTTDVIGVNIRPVIACQTEMRV